MTTEIDWGYNCLTAGIHHGRPEAIWNLPLHQASMMFGIDNLKQIVVARIRNDAQQFVKNGGAPSDEWADKVAELAEFYFLSTFGAKLTELTDYYSSSSWKNDVVDVIERIKQDKLSPHYRPLHGHDSINMLCRILGSKCSREATPE